jgi:hypothetical protein
VRPDCSEFRITFQTELDFQKIKKKHLFAKNDINLSIPYIHTEPNIWNIKKVILEVLEKFVNSGIDKDSKSLGAYYVLGALTLVNQDAATSLPWLFQSVNYF